MILVSFLRLDNNATKAPFHGSKRNAINENDPRGRDGEALRLVVSMKGHETTPKITVIKFHRPTVRVKRTIHTRSAETQRVALTLMRGREAVMRANATRFCHGKHGALRTH